MTWQGGGSGTPGEPPEDDTQVAWPAAASGSQLPAEPPPAPPPPPGAPVTPVPTGPGDYLYPAEIAEQPSLAPQQPVVPDPPVLTQPPVMPAAQPPAAQPPPFQPAGGYAPPGGTWQPPQAVYQPPPGTLKFGGVLPRLLAYLLDSTLVSIVVWVIGAVLGAIGGSGVDSLVITTVLSTGVFALYFIGFWTSGGRATPGMRLFHLQIGQAADGRTLTMTQAVVRWVAMGYPFTLIGVVPELAIIVSGLLMIWEVVLLVSTALSDTRQGLHDRVAGSAIVAPEGNEGPVVPCLVLTVILFVVLPIVAIVGLIALGTQVQEILLEVGGSI